MNHQSTTTILHSNNNNSVLTLINKEPLSALLSNTSKYTLTKIHTFINKGREERIVIQIPTEISNKELEPPQVIWYYGSSDALRVHRKYKFSSHQHHPNIPIIPNDVCLCSFSSNEPMLCILLDNSRIEIYGESGRSFIVSLPCKMSKIWSLNGEYLLVERKVVNPAGKSSTTPIFYYLTHPLEDLKGIASVVDGPSNNEMEDDVLISEPTFDYLKNEEEVVAYIFSNLFMITFNNSSKILTIYSILEEGFIQRIPYADNNDFSDYLKCNLQTVQISIFPQNNFGTEYTLFLINNNSLFAFTIFRNNLEEVFVLKPKFFKEGVVSIAEFNYTQATLFNGNIEGFLHLMILSENSKDSLILVLDGEFIMWEQALESIDNMRFTKIEHLVENRVSLKTKDCSIRYKLDICPNSKIVQDCLSVFQSVLTKDLFSSIFYDFQTSRIGNANDWNIFINLLNYLTFGIEPSSPPIDESDPWKLMELIHSKCDYKTSNQAAFNTSKLRTNKQVFIQNLPLILLSLHLLYENYKLQTPEWNNMETLVQYLFNLSCKLKWMAYSELYQRDFNYSLSLSVPPPPQTIIENVEYPEHSGRIKFLNKYYTSGLIAPTIIGWIEDIFIKKSLNAELMYPSINNCTATSLSRKICRLFSLLITNKEDNYNVEDNKLVSMDINGMQTGILDLQTPHERVVIALLQEGFSNIDELGFLPFSISLPIREAIVQCRNSTQPVTRTPQFCKLIEREDLAVNNQSQSQSEVLLDGNQIVTEFTKILGTGIPSSANNNKQQDSSEDDIGHMIWSEDRRLEQVSKMLDSSIPTQIQKHTLQLSEDDLDGFDPNDAPELQRKILLNVKQQVLSFCIGRGMLSIASKKNNNTSSISNDTTSNILTIPPIVLSSKLKRNRAIMTIDVSKIIPENEISASCSTQWAEFHNGVASGLTIGRDSKITKEWIMFHKPNKRGGQFMTKNSNDSVSHAGLLLALGLQGHLTCLGPTDIYGYLQQRHEATTIGILLGLSCSYVGTQDQYITRSLSLYIPSLVVGMSDMEMPMEVSGASLVGIGLLYMGSGHRFMTEVLLGELARPPNDNSTNSRESYSLSAGFALGFVHLGKGANGNSHELKMDQRLLSYMTGGSKRPEFDTFAMMASKSKSQMVQKGGKGQNTSEFVGSSCSRIKENENFVNVDVTGPGACIALTLKYLKTHDQAVASEMKVPDTKYMLDYVRPDMLILRMVGSSLIMWDQIKNTDEWIKSKLPGVLNNTQPISIVESSELSRIYAHSVSGCCFAIGLKYAGSHDTKAFNLLLGLLQQVTKSKLKILLNNDQMQIPYHINLDKYTTDRVVTVILLSISCVMSGSGNIEIIRIIKSLRQKYVASSATQHGGYGIHMALSMSLGLLLLGGGRCSLSTNDRSIAALLCSLYPVFPQTTTDNRYHSQALRHMYILSTENRLIETIDIDTKERCHVPIQIETTHGDILHKLTPCLIPESHLLRKITTMNERYYPLTISEFPLRSHIINVKKKSGYLTYKDDPKGIRSTVHSNFISNLVDQDPESLVKLFEKMSYHTHIGPYVKYRIFTQNNISSEERNIANAIDSLSLNNEHSYGNVALMLYHSLTESLTNDCPDVLYLFESILNSLKIITSSDHDQNNCNTLSKSIYTSCFKQLFSYYNCRNDLLHDCQPQQSTITSPSSNSTTTTIKPLITAHFIECIKTYLEHYFTSLTIDWTTLSNNKESGAYCLFYNIPYLYLLKDCIQQNQKVMNKETLVTFITSILSHSSISHSHIENLIQHLSSSQ